MPLDLLDRVPRTMLRRYSEGFSAPPTAEKPQPAAPPSEVSPERKPGLLPPVPANAEGGGVATPPKAAPVRKPLPWDLRMVKCMYDFLKRRPVLRLVGLYPKARMAGVLLWHMLRRKCCTPQTWALRNWICLNCPAMTRGKRGGWYCTECGCPQWWGSELHRKNQLAGQHCVHRLHPGEYPPGYELTGPTSCGGRKRGQELRMKIKQTQRTRHNNGHHT
jgi:hypothetical protein